MIRSTTMNDKRILIIDDEKDFGFLMTEFFLKKGCKVSIAYSIAEGMKILENEKPDYIFLDNSLPDGFGWREAEFILGNYPQARLILISTLEAPHTSSPSFNVLYKPLINEELHRLFG
jgi:DNA-binding response OmpR family regulator